VKTCSQATQELTVRSEHAGDYLQIEALLDSAFQGHDEAELVDRIRLTPQYINDLTLVAARGYQILGFIMLSYVTLQGEHESFRVLSLGPVAVLPTLQKQGIGSKLMDESIRLADERREPLIVLLGHASYYSRFGFERASARNILPPVAWPDSSYMVRTLTQWTQDMQGTIVYPPAWQIE
jgi:putative acetyltransferase